MIKIEFRAISVLQRIIGFSLICSACVALGAAPASGAQRHVENMPPPRTEALHCLHSGMTAVAAPDGVGPICEPRSGDATSRIAACLKVGMEAVLIPDLKGVLCAPAKKGGLVLDQKREPSGSSRRYPFGNVIDAYEICSQRRDARLLDKRIVKQIFQKIRNKIDPTGIRIIGGIYCEGIDLAGLDLPFSLVLDRSIFLDRVDIRNFRSKGDLAFDNSVAYASVQINRAEISGSIWMTFGFFTQLTISNAAVGGSLKIDHSVIPAHLLVENVAINGDLDISTSYFSQLQIFKDKIGGVLDLSQSQARCGFDIRKNEIGDLIATEFGFGTAARSEKGEAVPPYRFMKDVKGAFGRPLPKDIGDPYDRFLAPETSTAKSMRGDERCDYTPVIKPGTLLIVDNDVKSSVCLRSFNWLADAEAETLQSNIYFNEDVIEGATWLDIAGARKIDRDKIKTADIHPPILSLFNVKTGTLILNFSFTEQATSLNVNGLHFERIYASGAKCEAAVSFARVAQSHDWRGRATRPRLPAKAGVAKDRGHYQLDK